MTNDNYFKRFFQFLNGMVEKIEKLEKRVEELENQPVQDCCQQSKSIGYHIGVDMVKQDVAPIFTWDELSFRQFKLKTRNQQRKELIEEAKKKVDLNVERRTQHLYEDFVFYVNHEKRAVTCIIKDEENNVLGVGVAKCDPNDVFNKDIGKLIAMRRACGSKTIEAKFLDPVQPDSLTKGFRYQLAEQNGDDPDINYVDFVKGEKAFTGFKGEDGWIYSDIEVLKKDVKALSYNIFLDDTNAEY